MEGVERGERKWNGISGDLAGLIYTLKLRLIDSFTSNEGNFRGRQGTTLA